MKTTICTSRYIRSHAKAPRGFGYWLFETADKKIVVEHRGTYAEAKKVAQQSNFEILFTCP